MSDLHATIPGGRHWKSTNKTIGFTPREDELMRAIMNGATTYPEMMSALKVANRTINTMLCSMHAKTGSNNLADLILWRIKQGTD